MQARAVVPKLW